MTRITHHPDPSTLMSFSAGSLPGALAAVVAAHTDFCPQCRRELETLRRVGAALFEAMPPKAVRSPAPVMELRRAEADHDDAPPVKGVPGLPRSLSRLWPGTLETVPWRRLGLGVWHHRLESPTGDLRLLKVAAGKQMPEHGHGGMELTLLLRGSYTDETGTYRCGDIADLDDSIEHTPIADVETGCICLIASEKPARFKGLIPRLVQPLTGM